MVFGKLYRRSFIESYNIRFNTSLSNEDTGFNCVVKGCTDKVWYIPKDVYIWHFKANSITRINKGMYGQDSGYKGYLDNMVWQILELQKRFVNKNYIMNEIVAIMCVLYHFHIENMQNYPMNRDVSLNWIRGYYQLVYRPYEDLITETMFNQTFARVAVEQNISSKGIIPTITIYEFMDQVRAEMYTTNLEDEVCGSTPAGFIPPITDKDWPVEITEYIDRVEKEITIDSNTNFSRYGGMKKMIGLDLDDKDYDPYYTGNTTNTTGTAYCPKTEYTVCNNDIPHDDDDKPCEGSCSSCNSTCDENTSTINESTKPEINKGFFKPYNPNSTESKGNS